MGKIPTDLINFVLVVVFSFIIGLEQRLRHPEIAEKKFGTDRTYALIAILGFIFYIISPNNLMPFFIGFCAIIIFLLAYYVKKLISLNDPGITTILTGIISYSLAPLFYTQKIWLVLLVIVTILVIIEIKEEVVEFSKKIDKTEITTLAKFILITGIILPLLPHKAIAKNLNISAYKFWLTIVAVSTISYLSYLLKKYVFPKAGTILTALLGGLYSSTATTLILSRESKKSENAFEVSAGIITATAMMYIRLLILAFIFNAVIAEKLTIYFAILVVSTIPFVFFYLKKRNKETNIKIEAKKNPLELKTALIFAILFAFFAILTQFIVGKFGSLGVNILSFIVGVTDIDPYIMSLFQDTSTQLTVNLIVHSVVIATISNNLIKMVYAIILGDKKIRMPIITAFLSLTLISTILLLVVK